MSRASELMRDLILVRIQVSELHKDEATYTENPAWELVLDEARQTHEKLGTFLEEYGS